MPWHHTPGVQLWYQDTGGVGQPVVLVHPATGTSAIWNDQVTALVAAGYRVVTFDRRGAGRSHLIQPDVGDHLSDLGRLISHLGLSTPHLVGSAMGGADVLAYAVRNPGSTGSIVVSNSYAGVADPGYRTILDRIWATEVLRLPAHLLELSPALRGRQPERVAEWLRIHDDAAAGAEDDVAFRVPLDQLSGLTQPVLIIAGDADLLAPPALMRTLHEHIPGSRFAVIPETGHASAFESPEAWNSEVLGFLEMADRRD